MTHIMAIMRVIILLVYGVCGFVFTPAGLHRARDIVVREVNSESLVNSEWMDDYLVRMEKLRRDAATRSRDAARAESNLKIAELEAELAMLRGANQNMRPSIPQEVIAMIDEIKEESMKDKILRAVRQDPESMLSRLALVETPPLRFEEPVEVVSSLMEPIILEPWPRSELKLNALRAVLQEESSADEEFLSTDDESIEDNFSADELQHIDSDGIAFAENSVYAEESSMSDSFEVSQKANNFVFDWNKAKSPPEIIKDSVEVASNAESIIASSFNAEEFSSSAIETSAELESEVIESTMMDKILRAVRQDPESMASKPPRVETPPLQFDEPVEVISQGNHIVIEAWPTSSLKLNALRAVQQDAETTEVIAMEEDAVAPTEENDEESLADEVNKKTEPVLQFIVLAKEATDEEVHVIDEIKEETFKDESTMDKILRAVRQDPESMASKPLRVETPPLQFDEPVEVISQGNDIVIEAWPTSSLKLNALRAVQQDAETTEVIAMEEDAVAPTEENDEESLADEVNKKTEPVLQFIVLAEEATDEEVPVIDEIKEEALRDENTMMDKILRAVRQDPESMASKPPRVETPPLQFDEPVEVISQGNHIVIEAWPTSSLKLNALRAVQQDAETTEVIAMEEDAVAPTEENDEESLADEVNKKTEPVLQFIVLAKEATDEEVPVIDEIKEEALRDENTMMDKILRAVRQDPESMASKPPRVETPPLQFDEPVEVISQGNHIVIEAWPTSSLKLNALRAVQQDAETTEVIAMEEDAVAPTEENDEESLADEVTKKKEPVLQFIVLAKEATDEEVHVIDEIKEEAFKDESTMDKILRAVRQDPESMASKPPRVETPPLQFDEPVEVISQGNDIVIEAWPTSSLKLNALRAVQRDTEMIEVIAMEEDIVAPTEENDEESLADEVTKKTEPILQFIVLAKEATGEEVPVIDEIKEETFKDESTMDKILRAVRQDPESMASKPPRVVTPPLQFDEPVEVISQSNHIVIEAWPTSTLKLNALRAVQQDTEDMLSNDTTLAVVKVDETIEEQTPTETDSTFISNLPTSRISEVSAEPIERSEPIQRRLPNEEHVEEESIHTEKVIERSSEPFASARALTPEEAEAIVFNVNAPFMPLILADGRKLVDFESAKACLPSALLPDPLPARERSSAPSKPQMHPNYKAKIIDYDTLLASCRWGPEELERLQRDHDISATTSSPVMRPSDQDGISPEQEKLLRTAYARIASGRWGPEELVRLQREHGLFSSNAFALEQDDHYSQENVIIKAVTTKDPQANSKPANGVQEENPVAVR